ncbi:MAG: hypothetical protein ACO3IB_00750 [Phycisphaerales bacterium]
MRAALVLAPTSLALLLSFPGAVGSAMGQDAPAAVPPTVPAEAAPAEAPRFVQGPTDPAIEAVVRERLSRAFAQRTRNLLQRELVFLGLLECAAELSRISVSLEPGNPLLWRFALDLASTMAEGDPNAAAFGGEALSRINELEPDDEVIRLRRLLGAVSSRQTAESRLDAYRTLLDPQGIERIGPRVAARLALDRALLRQRIGDVDGYREDLLQAIDLDPVFPEAAEIAAGYFAIAASSPVEHADALRTAVVANPSRPAAALELASVCIQHGAYAAAAEILALEARLLETCLPNAEYDALLADLVLAHWGARDSEAAYLVARKRQAVLDAVLHAQLERDGAILDMKRRKEARLPATVTLSTNIAALASAQGIPEAKILVQNNLVSFQTQLEALDRFDAGRQELPRTRLEGAFIQLWLDGDLRQATDWIEQSSKDEPLSDDAKARFDGLVALRSGDAAGAKAVLAPVAERDTGARLGLALAHEALGERKEAARHLLEIARKSPDTAIGLWCRDRLQVMLGQTLDLAPDAAAVSKAAELPVNFVRFLEGGGGNLLIRVVPRRTEVRTWDPIIFDIVVTNRGNWPLAIGKDGPVRDTATVTSALNIAGTRPEASPFSIVQIDRKLRLDPGESVTIPLDMSLTEAATKLRDYALTGAFASVHTIVNWRTTQRGLEPGPLGLELESPLVHVEGVRLTKEWVDEGIARLADPVKPVDPELIAYLAYAVLRAESEEPRIPAEVIEALKAAPAALAAAVRRVSPESRAWLVFACPGSQVGEDASAGLEALGGADGPAVMSSRSACPGLEPLDAVLRSDESAMTRIAWLSLRVRRPEDPVLEASVKSADPRVSAYATRTLSWMNDTQAERRRRLNLAP